MRSRTKQAERGSIMAVSAFGMLAFLLAVGLCVDISHFYVVRPSCRTVRTRRRSPARPL
jgi:hypothetical protein